MNRQEQTELLGIILHKILHPPEWQVYVQSNEFSWKDIPPYAVAKFWWDGIVLDLELKFQLEDTKMVVIEGYYSKNYYSNLLPPQEITHFSLHDPNFFEKLSNFCVEEAIKSIYFNNTRIPNE